MITAEQVLTSGVGMLLGAVIGKAVCILYVPSLSLQPFQVFWNARDIIELYSIVSAMIIIGLLILVYVLSRIKIYQVVRLGDDE